MKSRKPITPFSPYEVRKFILPVTLAAILVLVSMILDIAIGHFSTYQHTIYIAIAGILYLVFINILIVRSIILKPPFSILNPIITGLGLGYLSVNLPQHLVEVNHILFIFAITAIVTASRRRDAYIALAIAIAFSLRKEMALIKDSEAILEYFTPIIVAIIIMEVINRIKETAYQHVNRLETINKVSHKIMQTLDTRETIALLDATIQETLVADTYFIGIAHGDDIKLELFYDEGEYFNGLQVPLKGTLSGWVIKNQKELYLPDLREDVELDDVELFVLGQEKTNLSWIGVPLKTENVTGIIVLASYTANAFDRTDMELLSNLGQHVTLALDNTIRHAQVEQQARLDSLTGVYNHGYFLQQLAEQATIASQSNNPLSLIMLDIDYFKQYNDTFGHLVGDRILEALCMAVKQNIKHDDAIGRWGGEEFAVSLPGANGKEAYQVAKRISQTLGNIRIVDLDERTIPIPTISQGIATFPDEANEIYRLVDVADRRLYVAKERGRNQIESPKEFWDN